MIYRNRADAMKNYAMPSIGQNPFSMRKSLRGRIAMGRAGTSRFMGVRNFTAFSLIELLLLLSVIALLIALLLPAMGRIRHGARVKTCVGNAGAIAGAFQSYLSDHNQVYPGGLLKDGQNLGGWNLMGKQGWRRGSGSTPQLNRPLNHYLNSVRLAHCPLDLGQKRPIPASHYDRFGSSYYYENRPMGDILSGAYRVQWGVWFIEGHRFAEVKYPDKKLLVSDAMRQLNRPATDPYNHWHNLQEPLQVSVAFADGHAANLPRKLGTESGEPEEFQKMMIWNLPTPEQFQKLHNWAVNTAYY